MTADVEKRKLRVKIRDGIRPLRFPSAQCHAMAIISQTNGSNCRSGCKLNPVLSFSYANTLLLAVASLEKDQFIDVALFLQQMMRSPDVTLDVNIG